MNSGIFLVLLTYILMFTPLNWDALLIELRIIHYLVLLMMEYQIII